jgi:hypothetical protein
MKITMQCKSCGKFVGFSYVEVTDKQGDHLSVRPDECECGSKRIMQIAEGGRYHMMWCNLKAQLLGSTLEGDPKIIRIMAGSIATAFATLMQLLEAKSAE